MRATRSATVFASSIWRCTAACTVDTSSAAATPLPETSATRKASRPPESGKKSK